MTYDGSDGGYFSSSIAIQVRALLVLSFCSIYGFQVPYTEPLSKKPEEIKWQHQNLTVDKILNRKTGAFEDLRGQEHEYLGNTIRKTVALDQEDFFFYADLDNRNARTLGTRS